MKHSLTPWLVAGLALAAAVGSADAQTVRRHHGQTHVHYAAPAGDIVVHARPSYLTAGTSASPGEWGTGARYATDTTPYSFVEMGPPHAFGSQGFDEPLRLFDATGGGAIADFW